MDPPCSTLAAYLNTVIAGNGGETVRGLHLQPASPVSTAICRQPSEIHAVAGHSPEARKAGRPASADRAPPPALHERSRRAGVLVECMSVSCGASLPPLRPEQADGTVLLSKSALCRSSPSSSATFTTKSAITRSRRFLCQTLLPVRPSYTVSSIRPRRCGERFQAGVLLAFACPSRVPWLVGCNRRMPDTGSRLAGLAPGRSCSPRELVASLSHLFALLIVRAPRARREVDR
jgi:hypothetical protein